MEENLPVTREERDMQVLVDDAAHKAKILQGIVEQAGLAKNFGGNKPHLEYPAWNLIAEAHGSSAKIQWTKPVIDPQTNDWVGWEARAILIDRDGNEIGSGEHECTIMERNWKNRDSFALKGMAQTRALSRAIRQKYSWVAVLAGYSPTAAEEMIDLNEDKPEKYSKPSKKDKPLSTGQVKLVWAKAYEVWPEKEDAQKEMKGILRGRYKIESTKEMTQEMLTDFLEYIDKVQPEQGESIQ